MSKPIAYYRAVRLAVALVVVPGALMLAACYPGEVTSINQLDVVVTNWDTTYVWAKPDTTFGVYDSVFHIVDSTNPGDTITLSRQLDSLIIANIKTGLERLGYTGRIVPTTADSTWVDSVDYLLIASALKARNITITSWYPYYPWYPGWGWGWYPPYYQVDSYETGTLFIDMYNDVIDTVTQTAPPIPWQAILNGPLSSSASVNQQRLTDGIAQAFEQSPYLSPR